MSSGLETWRVEARDFPVSGSDREKLQFLVNYAVLAPSKCNAQPWLFEICGDSLDLICDRHWAFREVDPAGRELIMSCGAALLNLMVAAAHFGYGTRVQTFPWPGVKYLLARVRLAVLTPGEERTSTAPGTLGAGGGTGPAQSPLGGVLDREELFVAMQRRCTSRRHFERRMPAAETLAGFAQAMTPCQAWLHWLDHQSTRRKVVELVGRGDREQMANKPLRSELARWLQRPHAAPCEGYPASRFGLHGPMQWLAPGVGLGLRALDLGHLVAYRDRRLAQEGPVLGVLGTAQDTPGDWLAAGQALELLWLLATAAGLSISVFSQPTEMPHLRAELTRIIGTSGSPQVLFRLGYGARDEHTPRRPTTEVVI